MMFYLFIAIVFGGLLALAWDSYATHSRGRELELRHERRERAWTAMNPDVHRAMERGVRPSYIRDMPDMPPLVNVYFLVNIGNVDVATYHTLAEEMSK